MNRKIHSVRYNFIMNFILSSSQFIFPIITFPYISRVLQATGNGKISFVSAVTNYFVLVASLGIPTYGVRACAQVRDDEYKLSKTVQEIFIINFIMTVITVSVYIICILVIPRFQTDRILFLINGVNILLNMFGMNWLFQALEQYDYITIRSIVFKVVSVVLMFVFVHEQDDYIIYGIILVFASVGSNILNFARAVKIVQFKKNKEINLKKHLRPIFIMFAQSIAVSIYTNLDTVMLGFIKSDKDVGYYNAAVKIKTILLSLVTSLGNVLLPRMSYYAKNNMDDEFEKTTWKALNFTALMSIPLVLFFDICAKNVMCILAGNTYLDAVPAMQIITGAIIPAGITGVLGVQVLIALEKEMYVLYSVIVAAISDFVLNLVFIPYYGAAGAALATTIAEFFVLLIQVWCTRKILQKRKKDSRIRKYTVISMISSSGLCLVCKMITTSIWVNLLISAIVFWGIYVIGLLIVKEPIFIESIDKIMSRMKGEK